MRNMSKAYNYAALQGEASFWGMNWRKRGGRDHGMQIGMNHGY